ncbi:hypothetical protein NL108_000277, partial [Boleophthalmus pectinirostris]
FLQITPEGSPQAQRRGELGGDLDVSGSFCLHTSGISTQQVFEKHHTSTISIQHTRKEHPGVSSESAGTVQSQTSVTRHTAQTETPPTGPSTPMEGAGH